jgi:class 3 adenylate cyclase
MVRSTRFPKLVEAGRAAFTAQNWPGAVESLREADATGQLDPEDVERLAEAAFWSGHLEECIAARERAYVGLIKTDQKRAASLVALHLAFHHAGRRAIAVAGGWLENAVGLLASEPECAEQGWLAWIQAIVAGEMLGDREEAVRYAARVVSIGRALGDRDVEALGLLTTGGAFVHLGRVDEGLALLDRVMLFAVTGQLGPWASAATYCGTISTCAALGDYRRAAEWIEEVQRRAAVTGACEFPGDCRLHRAEILHLRGEWAEAEVEAARACDELERWDVAHVAVGLYELGLVSLRRGDLAAAEGAFRQVDELGGSCQPGGAMLQLARGRPETAWASLREALEAAGSERLSRAQLLPAATDAALRSGDVIAARLYADELAMIADAYPNATQRARAASAIGAVAAATGDLDVAQEKLRDVGRLWQEVGAPFEHATARVALGEVLRAAGDSDAGDLQLRSALDTFERLGATADAARVLELLGRTMPRSRVVRTFMFTDIEDSTVLLAAMGDERWSEVLQWHDAVLRRLFAQFAGQEIKQRGGGDGFFVAFSSATAALDCAIAIQQAMNEESQTGRVALRIRIGAHEAEATRTADDYSGRGIHEAARIAALARGGEVLVSARMLAPAGSSYRSSETRSVQLKGLVDPIEVASLRIPHLG